MVGTIIVCIISVLLCITGALLQKGYEFDFLRSLVPPPQVLYSPSGETSESPSPASTSGREPHTFGSNELTAKGKAFLNGQVLFAMDPTQDVNVTVKVDYEPNIQLSKGSIGHDLRAYLDFDGLIMRSGEKTTVRANEDYIIVVNIVEDDDAFPDTGSEKIKFHTPDSIKHGDRFSLNTSIKVKEKGGNKYSRGDYVVFDVNVLITVG